MKSKNGSGLIIGIVITVVSVIIVGIVVLWGFGYFTKNKKTLDTSTGKIDKAVSSMAVFDLDVYDGNILQGNALTELIADFMDKDVVVSIGVKTLDTRSSTVYYNYNFTGSGDTANIVPTPKLTTTPPTAKDSANYINPNGSFKGDVIRNANDEIVCILFTQQ